MSYPIDESCLGVYDLSGSVSEWLDTYWQQERGTYWAAGGSWAIGTAWAFGVGGGQGRQPDYVSDTIGFRLVMRTGVAAP